MSIGYSILELNNFFGWKETNYFGNNSKAKITLVWCLLFRYNIKYIIIVDVPTSIGIHIQGQLKVPKTSNFWPLTPQWVMLITYSYVGMDTIDN